MGPLIRFLIWLGTQAWRYGTRAIAAVAKWARANWKRVVSWLERGISFATIVQWILQTLGLA